jgi:PAS domain-containing protein
MSVFDVIALLAFFVAAIMGLRLPVSENGILSSRTRFMLATAMGIYVLIALGDLLVNQAVVGDIRVYIHYVEVLFVPLLLYSGFSIEEMLKDSEVRMYVNALEAEHALVMEIIESTPTGIVVLDDMGGITFANARAIGLLSLTQDPDTGRFWCPPCDVVQPAVRIGEVPTGIFAHLVDEAIERIVHILKWPDGRTQVLSVSCQPIEDDGAVIAFDETGTWPSGPAGQQV